MIIGLTGSMGSGKGEVVKILERLGFRYVTLSQMVRQEARGLGVPEEREKLMEVGNEMRQKEGPGVLGQRALREIRASGDSKWVVDGIRNPAEIDALRESGDVHIIALRAKRELLVERILKRGRDSDPKTAEEVIARIEREWGKGEPEDGQQMKKCVKKADIPLTNENTLEALDKKMIDLYNRFQQ